MSPRPSQFSFAELKGNNVLCSGLRLMSWRHVLNRRLPIVVPLVAAVSGLSFMLLLAVFYSHRSALLYCLGVPTVVALGVQSLSFLAVRTFDLDSVDPAEAKSLRSVGLTGLFLFIGALAALAFSLHANASFEVISYLAATAFLCLYFTSYLFIWLLCKRK